MLTVLKRRRMRKRLRETMHHARQVYHMRRDVMAPEILHALDEAIAQAHATYRQRERDPDRIQQRIAGIETALPAASGSRRWPVFSENFEVLLVAIAVAMAFRAYFFQPFKIPTGSMQPTLYGIHSVEREQPGFWDRMPFKPVKWVLTGSWYRRIVIQVDGDLRLAEQVDRPGYITLVAAGRQYHLPSDAVRQRQALNVREILNQAARVQRGDVLWAGDVIAGDHVFVNRMTWNFRRPRRGDVMVFSTDGIRDLQQGTHYIKRMVGLPGESIGIDPPELIVNDQPVRDVPQIRRIAERRKLADWASPYAGFQLVQQVPNTIQFDQPLVRSDIRVQLAEDEYYGFGDNTSDSLDSRYFGPIPERNLVGPGSLVYWPFRSPRWGRMR